MSSIHLVKLSHSIAGLTLATLFVVTTSMALSQSRSVGKNDSSTTQAPPPALSPNALTPEQLAVYKAFLADWFGEDKKPIHLANQTEPLDADGFGLDDRCLALHRWEAANGTSIHQFRQEDVAALSNARVSLVNAKAQDDEVKANDPGNAIREGLPVDDAVENGFAHALLTLSEIRFDKSHTHALVAFTFHCGMLCGNSNPVILSKRTGGWKVVRHCGGWIS